MVYRASVNSSHCALGAFKKTICHYLKMQVSWKAATVGGPTNLPKLIYHEKIEFDRIDTKLVLKVSRPK